MTRQIGFDYQTLPAPAMEERLRALERRVEVLNDAVTALREQLRETRSTLREVPAGKATATALRRGTDDGDRT